VRSIVDIEDNFEGKLSHFLVDMGKNKMHLKCDNYDEKDLWLKAIEFMRNKFRTSGMGGQYKEGVDDETRTRIYAENEWANWEEIRVRK
jgi:hypothetical protein